jgi:hypothetical protein
LLGITFWLAFVHRALPYVVAPALSGPWRCAEVEAKVEVEIEIEIEIEAEVEAEAEAKRINK